MSSRLAAAALFVTALVVSHDARAQDRAPIGQPCGARADCADGLHCVANVCVDAATFESRTSEAASSGNWGFVGGAIGFLFPAVVGQYGGAGEGAQLSLRLGVVLADVFQLQLDLAPATVIGNAMPSAIGMFEAAATVGVLIPISDEVSWILRLGGGGGAMFGGREAGFGELRADVAGVAIRTSRHVFLEFNGPSWRLLFMPQGSLSTTFVTNVMASYVF